MSRGWQRCWLCESRRRVHGRSYCQPCALAAQRLAYYWRTQGLMLEYDASQRWSRWWRPQSGARPRVGVSQAAIARARWAPEFVA